MTACPDPNDRVFSFYYNESTNYPCRTFNILGFLLFLLTTVKSVHDLIKYEFVYRDVPLKKITLCKLFHLLIPFAEFAICFSCINYDMYCTDIACQRIGHTLITAGGGYILVLCFLINALHWALIASGSLSRRFRFLIISGIAIVFIIVPLVLEFLIVYYNPTHHKAGNETKWLNIHLAELIYIFLLNTIVVAALFMSWLILHRRLKMLSGVQTINRLKTRLTWQMSLYAAFFLVRSVGLLIAGVYTFANKKSGNTDANPYFPQTVFFISSALGDIPVVLVMLYFLQRKKPSTSTDTSAGSGTGGPANDSSASAAAAASTASYGTMDGKDTGGYGNGGGDGQGQQFGYQYTQTHGFEGRGQDVLLNTPHSGGFYLSDSNIMAQSAQVVYYNDGQYMQTSMYHTPVNAGLDASTNSYYTAEAGSGYV